MSLLVKGTALWNTNRLGEAGALLSAWLLPWIALQ